MAVNEVVLRHLQEARAELLDQVTHLSSAIDDLDRMIERYTQANIGPRVSTSSQRVPSMKEAIVNLMREQDREWRTQEIVERLGSRYGWASASTRSLLVKLSGDGTLRKVERGIYVLPPDDRAVDSEGPAVTGPSDQRGDDPASPPVEEGGEPGGDREPGGHDDRPRADTHHRDHHLGAPVVGAPR